MSRRRPAGRAADLDISICHQGGGGGGGLSQSHLKVDVCSGRPGPPTAFSRGTQQAGGLPPRGRGPRARHGPPHRRKSRHRGDGTRWGLQRTGAGARPGELSARGLCTLPQCPGCPRPLPSSAQRARPPGLSCPPCRGPSAHGALSRPSSPRRPAPPERGAPRPHRAGTGCCVAEPSVIQLSVTPTVHFQKVV